MAMSWGSYANRLSMGIDLALSGSVTQASPDTTINVETAVRTDYTTYNNDIDWERSNSAGGENSGSKRLNQGSGVTLESYTRGETASYSSTKSYTVTVKGSGPGAGPATYTRSITIPRRPTAAPTAPGTPACSSVGSRSMTISWGAPSDMKGTSVDYYRVEVSTTSNFSNIVKNPTTSSRSVTVTGLTPGDTYYVRVRLAATGWDGDSVSPNSSTRSQKMDYEAPDAVTGRDFSGTTSSAFTMTWDQPEGNGATVTKYGYEVRKSTDNSSRNGTIVKSGETTSRSLTATGLEPNTMYVVHNRAYNGLWGPWQVDPSVGGTGARNTTFANPPTLTGYTADQISRSSARIGSFVIGNNGGDPPNNVRVERNTTPSSSGSTVVTAGSWAKVTLSGLAPLTTYYYRAAAANSAPTTWGPYGPWQSFVTLDSLPSNPAPPTISAITNTGATVTWVAPAANGTVLENYIMVVARADNPDAPVKEYLLASTTLSQAVTGLSPGINYVASVMARSNLGDSGFSDPTAFLTTGVNATLFPYINVGGTFRSVTEVWLNVSGTWRKSKLGLNVGGVWKESA